jgi:hypothetical protein
MSGNGSSAAPFQIKDATGFNQIGETGYPLDAWYVLMNNIDGTGITTPIASDFTGNFNGNGNTIGTTNSLTTNLFNRIGSNG